MAAVARGSDLNQTSKDSSRLAADRSAGTFGDSAPRPGHLRRLQLMQAAAQLRARNSISSLRTSKHKPRCCQAYAVHNTSLQVSVRSAQAQCTRQQRGSCQVKMMSSNEETGHVPCCTSLVPNSSGSSRALRMIQVRPPHARIASADPAVDGGSLARLVALGPARLLHQGLHGLQGESGSRL